MKINRIKSNYRYIIYEITGKYYLVDFYDKWWITILFPFLGWFLYHKAYLLSKEEYLKFEFKKKKKVAPLAIGGISLIVSPMIVSMFENSTYIQVSSFNKVGIHTLLVIVIILVSIIVYMKCNRLDTEGLSMVKIRIFPETITSYLKGGIVMVMLPFLMFFLWGAQFDDVFVLNLAFLVFVLLGTLLLINLFYNYMENIGPYDYQFKNKEEQ